MLFWLRRGKKNEYISGFRLLLKTCRVARARLRCNRAMTMLERLASECLTHGRLASVVGPLRMRTHRWLQHVHTPYVYVRCDMNP